MTEKEPRPIESEPDPQLEQAGRIVISRADHEALLAALRAPPEPTPALRAAFETYTAVIARSEP